MKLPFEPRPLDELRARYPAAVERVFDYRFGFPAVWPSQLRAHVFDFEDGLRVMVSRDREEEDGTYLHVSASLEPGHGLFESVARGAVGLRQFLTIVEERFALLSGDVGRLDFCGLSGGKGVPHWRRREGH